MHKTGCKARYWSKISSKIEDNIWGTANQVVGKCCKGLSVVHWEVAAAIDGLVPLGECWAAKRPFVIRPGCCGLNGLPSSHNDRRAFRDVACHCVVGQGQEPQR